MSPYLAEYLSGKESDGIHAYIQYGRETRVLQEPTDPVEGFEGVDAWSPEPGLRTRSRLPPSKAAAKYPPSEGFVTRPGRPRCHRRWAARGGGDKPARQALGSAPGGSSSGSSGVAGDTNITLTVATLSLQSSLSRCDIFSDLALPGTSRSPTPNATAS
ncbi:hypothetical protein MAPG_05763 [Magnaporthiopsis poae ATCC 64411]|uniref:Uncharacterized protein n=1 Tax=Magnaporthiopsis poae (strain ATCC 64411 / 73-15) TaxID=644358 RepID=A0A0C4E097_MAGP6|nr:hypothetical protein MAPG_05763 [Magnaporthiopsis poae ATCC 64411]